jgi:pilus assembly protein CpaF
VYVERKGKLELTSKRFLSEDHLHTVIERIIAPLGRRIDESSPMVDARLPDGSRVNAIIPPLAVGGPVLSIRKFSRRRYTLEDLIQFGTLSQPMADFLRVCVFLRKNTVISGGAGSGKTTLLNVLSAFIPDHERIVTIEDAVELQLAQRHWVRLEARPENVERRGRVAARDLFRNALRMRPDRIIIGECRGGETLDMLQAMNTGHEGSMTTVHANSPRDVISRLDAMVLMSSIELPVRAIRQMVASAIQIFIQIARFPDGARKLTSISEVDRVSRGTEVIIRDLFLYRQTGVAPDGTILGHFAATGQLPSFLEEVTVNGIDLDAAIFASPAQTNGS